MAWLSATLAFATTMFFFALFVSTIVEALHRILGLRHQGMRLMLEALYDNVIRPHVEKVKPKPTTTAKQFADIIMTNRPVGGGSLGTNGRIGAMMLWLTRKGESTNIPTEIFTQRLVDSRMVEVANALTEDVVRNIAQQYEAYGKDISEFFRARAQLLSLIVAFVIAFAFQVHPHALMSAYMSEPGLADRIVATIEGQEGLIERMEKIAAAPAPVAEAGAAGSPAPADGTAELRAALQELEAEIDSAGKALQALSQAGVPVGWGDIRTCDKTERWTQPCLPTWGTVFTMAFGGTVFWLLVGGLLIGIGAPFWAQAVGALSATSGAAKRITELVSPETATVQANAVAAAAPPRAPAPAAPPPAVAAFLLARRSVSLVRDTASP